jgi:hypothetical protein
MGIPEEEKISQNRRKGCHEKSGEAFCGVRPHFENRYKNSRQNVISNLHLR